MKTTIILLMILLAIVPGVVADPDFIVEIAGVNSNVQNNGLSAGKEGSIFVEITNLGDAGSMKVETGVYKQSTLEDWYNTRLFSLVGAFVTDASTSATLNCEPGQPNVETWEGSLSSGESKRIEFKITAPTDSDELYGVHTTAFDVCYKNAPYVNGVKQTGQTSYDIEAVEVKNNPFNPVTPTYTCNDGIVNQDETAVDCGGVCGRCADYYDCRVDSDCSTTSVCDYDATNELVCIPNQQREETTDEEYTGSDEDNDEPGRDPTSENTVVDKGGDSRWVSVPVVTNLGSERAVGNAEEVIIQGTFFAAEDGVYLLEGGMGKEGGLNTLSVSVTGNECNPEDRDFSNKKINLKAGAHDITFSVAADEDGDYSFWTAYVPDCGEQPIHQLKGDGVIHVGTADDGIGEESKFWGNIWIALLIIIVLLVALAVIVGVIVWARE